MIVRNDMTNGDREGRGATRVRHWSNLNEETICINGGTGAVCCWPFAVVLSDEGGNLSPCRVRLFSLFIPLLFFIPC